MHMTQHISQRMAQRGITKDLIDVVLTHGEFEDDRAILDRKNAKKLLEELQRKERLIKKILDKGGLVVVTEGGALITTYNFAGREH